MGMYHIVTISNDALELNKERHTELESAVGKAIVSVCIAPQHGYISKDGKPPQLEKITWADILNVSGAVCHVDEVQYTDTEFYCFANARLCRLDELPQDELKLVREKIDEILARAPSL